MSALSEESVIGQMSSIIKSDENAAVTTANEYSDTYLEGKSGKKSKKPPVVPSVRPRLTVGIRQTPQVSVVPIPLPVLSPGEVEAACRNVMLADSEKPANHAPFSDEYLIGKQKSVIWRIMIVKPYSPSLIMKDTIAEMLSKQSEENKRILNEAVGNADLSDSLRLALSKVIQEKIAMDPDYDPKRFTYTNEFTVK